MLSRFIVSLKISDQLSLDHQSGSKHSDAALLSRRSSPHVSQPEESSVLRLRRGGREADLADRGFSGLEQRPHSSMSLFLPLLMSHSLLLLLSLTPSFPHPSLFPISYSPTGLSDRIVNVSPMSCPQALVCLATTKLSFCAVPTAHFSSLIVSFVGVCFWQNIAFSCLCLFLCLHKRTFPFIFSQQGRLCFPSGCLPDHILSFFILRHD